MTQRSRRSGAGLLMHRIAGSPRLHEPLPINEYAHGAPKVPASVDFLKAEIANMHVKCQPFGGANKKTAGAKYSSSRRQPLL